MSSAELASIDPATGATIWRGLAADKPVIDAAISRARHGLGDWSRRPLAERVDLACSFQGLVRSRAEDLAVLISRETGKPLWEARTEAESVAAKVDVSIDAQAERAGTRLVEAQGVRQVVRHKPHGVLAVIGPYNFPAHLPNGHIVPALLAGNTIVFKPSELTPAVAEFMEDCWRAAGLPAGVLNIVQGEGRTGRELASHPGIDGLLFTGSAHTGAAIARQFADRPHKILALEMGGNNPLIVWDAQNPQLAAEIVVQSAYLSAGQRCTSARRLIIEDRCADEIMSPLIELIDRLIVGAPFDEPQPFMGPVISTEAAGRLQTGSETLVAQGAEVIRPLQRMLPDRPFLTPALLDVTSCDGRSDEEHFGPLLQVIRVSNFEEALREANATSFGLAAGLIGGTRELYEQFWAESRGGRRQLE